MGVVHPKTSLFSRCMLLWSSVLILWLALQSPPKKVKVDNVWRLIIATLCFLNTVTLIIVQQREKYFSVCLWEQIYQWCLLFLPELFFYLPELCRSKLSFKKMYLYFIYYFFAVCQFIPMEHLWRSIQTAELFLMQHFKDYSWQSFKNLDNRRGYGASSVYASRVIMAYCLPVLYTCFA